MPAGGVADDYRRVDSAEAQEVPRRLFLCGVRQQGIRPRDICQHAAEMLGAAETLRGGHGLSGPVAGVLAHSGEGVEYRAFPHVGIPGDGDYLLVRRPALYHRADVRGGESCGITRQSHAAPPR